MKNIIYVSFFVTLLLFGCQNKSSKNTSDSIKRVVILQNKPQEWADALKLGFSDGLLDAGYIEGEDFILMNRSATGDPLALTTIAKRIANDKNIDLIYALGTQSSQEIFSATKTKNILFGAVTDPLGAGFYSENLDSPSGNISGTQDLWPYPAQFDLIHELIPNLTSIGVLYSSSEINSQVSIEYIKKECNSRDIKLIERAVSSEQEVSIALSSILNKEIDLFFIPADNTAQSSSNYIIAQCNRRNIPVFTGISGIVESGAIATVGTNYYELGKVNARQAIEILFKNKKASEIPVSIADKGDIYLNSKACKANKIEISESLAEQAFKIYE